MRGGHSVVSREMLAHFPEIIEELGYRLASKHQTQSDIIAKENKLDPPQIHDRDYRWEIASGAGVFEISNPSLGAGSEISDMLHMGKPVLCLFTGKRSAVSAYIRGKQGSIFTDTPYQCSSYTTRHGAKRVIKKFLATYYPVD